MRKHRFNSFMTAAVIASTLLTATACSKTFAPVDTLPVGTELPADTSTSTEAASTKQDSTTNKGGNTKETGTTKESGNASKDTGAGKDTGTKESDATEKSGEGNVSAEASKDSEKTTKAGSDSSVTTAATTNAETSKAAATVTETTTSKVTESTTAAAQAPTEKQTEKATEKVTESTTQAPTEKVTEKQTEKATEKATQPVHTHSYAETVTKQPTCTSEGIKAFKCSCGDSYTESIPAAGHIFGAYTYNNDATEQTDGTETAVCSICGEKNTRTASGTKLAHVHNYTATVTKAATCAEEGVTTYTCACGHSYTEPIAKTAHSFGEYVYNNDATTEKDGTKTATCSVCGVTDTVTAEGTKKSLPSWYDEHPDIPLNQTRGSQHDGSLEAWYVSGQFDWDSAKADCGAFGYSTATEIIGRFAEGAVVHGYLYK